MDDLKVAIVHEWLVDYGGSERVLEQMLQVFPQAEIFCVVDFLPDQYRHIIQHKPTRPSFIQHLPLARQYFRSYLPLMPLAIEQLDLRGFDLVISSSHAVAKGVITAPDQLHVAYVHSPMRYIWDLQSDYFADSWRSPLVHLLCHYLRLWDVSSTTRVDKFIANSHFIRRRIHKYYRRTAKVIYPPVAVDNFPCKTSPPQDFYLYVGRLVPYKRVDLIVEVFKTMPDRSLVIIGDGTERKKILSQLTPNITYLGYQPQNVVKEYMQKARAFLFAGVEDFGITPLEALSCGTPVIALAQGGLRETITPEVGVLFPHQTIESLCQAIQDFEQKEFDPQTCHNYAQKFNPQRFRLQLQKTIEQWLYLSRNIKECYFV
ncbi:MAG: glycosyltransferase [Pseudanabaenaceae cyanobacterium SKYGB_i_bin29]|nr:glycosyltransferase [Pseudanabaenaceae cyanobacterium SKYG29]MDW8422468.1 glycosyltransferase [Pseudanabaenaceae cyanobacterium SKYGB_i_bin29]